MTQSMQIIDHLSELRNQTVNELRNQTVKNINKAAYGFIAHMA